MHCVVVKKKSLEKKKKKKGGSNAQKQEWLKEHRSFNEKKNSSFP